MHQTVDPQWQRSLQRANQAADHRDLGSLLRATLALLTEEGAA